jgi:hypothetical protein
MVLVKFTVFDGEIPHYGIDCGDFVVCGCCGSTFEREEIDILDSWEGGFSIEDEIKETLEGK